MEGIENSLLQFGRYFSCFGKIRVSENVSGSRFVKSIR